MKHQANCPWELAGCEDSKPYRASQVRSQPDRESEVAID